VGTSMDALVGTSVGSREIHGLGSGAALGYSCVSVELRLYSPRLALEGDSEPARPPFPTRARHA